MRHGDARANGTRTEGRNRLLVSDTMTILPRILNWWRGEAKPRAPIFPGGLEEISDTIRKVYSSTNAYSVMSALARILTTNWAANNSTITLMYKTEPGVVPENLTATQMTNLLALTPATLHGFAAAVQSGTTARSLDLDYVYIKSPRV